MRFEGQAVEQGSQTAKLNPAAKDRESPSKSRHRSGLGGLLERRERWSLAPLGWLVFLVGLVLSTGFLLWRIYPFLAATDRTDSEFLVIEGWVPNYALKEGIAEFRTKPYRLMFTVGCDILNGVNVEEGDNHAIYAVKRLAWLGMDSSSVQPVASPTQSRDRTYASAVALREWFEKHNGVSSFNLMTLGVHARRSQLLFQEAFGNKVRVGIIAVADREYDPSRWWQYSEGVKEVISEGVGYLYARLFFHPPTAAEEVRPRSHRS